MERRKQIYEKIKDTKLNKLTVKQGDANVVLNLKVDLLDPKVDIAEKVLLMLENFAAQQNSASTEQQKPTTSVVESTPPQTPLVLPSSSILSNISKSPTKNYANSLKPTPSQAELIENIRKPPAFTNNKSPVKSTSNDNLKDSDHLSKQSKSSQSSSKPAKSTSNEHLINKQAMNESNNEEKNCRICRTITFQNERALYDHVTRVHGGKSNLAAPITSSNNQQSKRQRTGSENELDGCSPIFEEDDNNSSGSDVESLSDPHSKKSSLKKGFKYPNIALRLQRARVTSLNQNNKDMLNLNNDKLFSSGYRGNAFSQERFALKPCTIKMKLNEEHVQNMQIDDDSNQEHLKNKLESFLYNRLELSSISQVDRNQAVAIQAIAENSDTISLSKKEINDFFRKIQQKIPHKVARLDDIIKANETCTHLNSKEKQNVFRALHETILDAKALGIELSALKAHLSQKFKSISYTKFLNVPFIREQLSLLVENFLVLSVGVAKRVYVAYEFSESWVIKSKKNVKGRSTSTNESSDGEQDGREQEEEDDNNEDESQYGSTSQEEVANSSTRASLRRSASSKDNQHQQQQHTSLRSVCLIPRPWRYIDGLLNRPVLKQMFETFVNYLKMHPNASFESISEYFSPALQPIMTLEVLEMLEHLKCVRKILMKPESECNLFSSFTNESIKYKDESDSSLVGDEINCYSCNQEAIFILSKVFEK